MICGCREAIPDHGIVGHHINRSETDPTRWDVYPAGQDPAPARTWVWSDELRFKMQEAGVTDTAGFSWMTSVRDSILWDRRLLAKMVSRRVDDFATWLAGYDFIGQAASRSLDVPAIAIVYDQTESFYDMRSFLGPEELRLAMKKAAVASEPEVRVHTGGWPKRTVRWARNGTAVAGRIRIGAAGQVRSRSRPAGCGVSPHRLHIISTTA